MAKKSCKRGYYYCYASKKCKKIPMGYVVGMGGWLRKEKEEDETEGKKKNGNGNGADGNGNGNGGSNGGSDGGGVSEAWSAKYKKSIDCDNPKGFSQKAHCQGKKKVTEGKEGDHEVSMAKSQLKKSAENIAKLRKVLNKKTDKDNLPAWVQAKITDTEHNTDAAAGYMEEGKRDGKSAKDKGYSLRDWFKGGGWVQAGGKYDGKPCARQPGQKTKPFCRDADDRANMSKKERSRRAAKKRREDPNPNREGKAKMVSASYSNWRADLEQLDEGKKDACYHKVKSRYKVWPSAYASGALVKCRKVGAKNWGNKTKKEEFSNWRNDLEEMASEKKINKKIQKPVKTKDLNPSEYIKNSNMMPGSGIPKKLADDYQYSNWRDDFQATEYESVDIIKPEPLQATEGLGSEMLDEKKRLMNKLDKISGQLKKASAMHAKQSKEVAKVSQHLCAKEVKHEEFGYGETIFGEHAIPDENGFVSHYNVQFEHGIVENVSVEDMEVLTLTEHENHEMDGDIISEGGKKCWKGYKKVGTQKLFGKTYNRCVKAHFSDWRADMDLQEKKAKKNCGCGKEVCETYGKQEVKEDWQKSNRKDGVDGMSQKSVDAYRRENPGSKLQTAVTGKNPKGKDKKRRKSFCARSKGQKDMHNIDCSKTPEKKICKARKRWRC